MQDRNGNRVQHGVPELLQVFRALEQKGFVLRKGGHVRHQLQDHVLLHVFPAPQRRAVAALDLGSGEEGVHHGQHRRQHKEQGKDRKCQPEAAVFEFLFFHLACSAGNLPAFVPFPGFAGRLPALHFAIRSPHLCQSGPRSAAAPRSPRP